jgi:predicted nucleic acid-binding protein
MIAIDSSAFIAYFQGEQSSVSDLIDSALSANTAVLPPVVVAELLSDPKLPKDVAADIMALPSLDLTEEYWVRAGKTRSKLVAKKLKARLADTLIAQICIDHNLPLLTKDSDFKNFVKICGLKLVAHN